MKYILLVAVSLLISSADAITYLVDDTVENLLNMTAKEKQMDLKYATFNTNIIRSTYNKTDYRQANEANEEFKQSANPYLINANKQLSSITPDMTSAQKVDLINKAKLDLDRYQNARIQILNSSEYSGGAYYMIQREANLYYCTSINMTLSLDANNNVVSTIDAKHVLECEAKHNNNNKLDLNAKAELYGQSSIMTPVIMDILLNNIEYFSRDNVINDIKNSKSINNVSLDVCHKSVKQLRENMISLANDNLSIKLLLALTRPKSLVRDYIDSINVKSSNIVSDSLNAAYMILYNKTVRNQEIDVCEYSEVRRTAANNLFVKRIVNTDRVSNMTNGKITPEQLHQLFVIGLASSIPLIIEYRKNPK